MADEPIVEAEEVETATQAEDTPEVEEDPKPFEGEYDPQRARKLIDKLRDENAALKKQKEAPVEDPEKDALAVENLQLKVALELGIPAKLATRLRGATREELIEDAADLMDTVSPSREVPSSERPKPVLKGGSKPEVEPEVSAKDIAARLRV